MKPDFFAGRIRELRRDLSVSADAEEQSRLSNELLDMEDDLNGDVGEDVARDKHYRAMRQRGPRGGYPRETW